MKITNVEAIHLRMPAVEEVCNGTQDALLVRVHTDEGIVGLGEVDSSPHVIKAIIEAPTSHSLCHGIRELLLGENPLEIRRLWRKMYEGTIYYGRQGAALQAISGVDIALWDILGKVTGQPLYRLLGGKRHGAVEAYASVLMPDTPEEAAAVVRSCLAQGFRAVKLGWGPLGKDPDRDEELVRAAREAAGPRARLMIDVGHAFDAETALEAIRRWEPYDLFWVEEPLHPDDVQGYRRLTAQSPVRIAAGEEETGARAFGRFIRESGIHVAQPDLSRVGGITAGLEVAALCEEAGIRCVPHAFSTGILLSASIHFAAAVARGGLVEFCMDASPLAARAVRHPYLPGAEQFPAERPGLGVEVDEAVLDEYRQP